MIMHFSGDRRSDQERSSSRMSLAQNTITTTDTRKIMVAAAFTSGVTPRRSFSLQSCELERATS
jgi:hypothetical protein